MLKGLVLVAAVTFVLGLDLAPVVHLQLLILPSFRAVLGALFSLFPSMFKSSQIEICMPLKNARFQVTSGTKDPPAEKPIKLTKIEKTVLYSL